jgi:hypothetical protein
MRWARNVAEMGEMRNAYILVGKPEGKRSLLRTQAWMVRKHYTRS